MRLEFELLRALGLVQLCVGAPSLATRGQFLSLKLAFELCVTFGVGMLFVFIGYSAVRGVQSSRPTTWVRSPCVPQLFSNIADHHAVFILLKKKTCVVAV